MASERFDVRPFRRATEFDRAFAGCSMLFGLTCVEPGRRGVVSATRFQTDQVRLRLAPSAKGLHRVAKALTTGAAELDIAPDELDMVLVASTPRLKLAEIVWRCPLTDLGSGSHDIKIGDGDARPAALQAIHGGAQFDLYLALRVEQQRRPLHPWRKGTWLARAQFRFSTGLHGISFTPIRMTEEVRSHLGLPSGVVRYVDIDDPLLPGTDSSSVRLYVDEALLAEVARAPHTPIARSFQRDLFLSAVSAIANEAALAIARSGILPTLDEIEGSLVDRLLRRAAGSPDDPVEHRRAMEQQLTVLVREPEVFRSHAETWIPDLLKDWRLSHSEATV
jgi:hypothetical protein